MNRFSRRGGRSSHTRARRRATGSYVHGTLWAPPTRRKRGLNRTASGASADLLRRVARFAVRRAPRTRATRSASGCPAHTGTLSTRTAVQAQLGG